MSTSKEAKGPERTADFKLDEVIRLKGHCFKVVLIDGFAAKLALKWISFEEARLLEAGASTAGKSVIHAPKTE